MQPSRRRESTGSAGSGSRRVRPPPRFLRSGGVALLAALLLCLLPGLPAGAAGAEAQLSGGIVLDRDGLRHLHVALGQAYGEPVHRVERRWRSSRVHPSELPVVYLLAREARVSEEAVLALRERGWAWADVALHLGLSPRVFVRDLPGGQGRGQGKKQGRGHRGWELPPSDRLHSLSDREVVYWVNVALRMGSDPGSTRWQAAPSPRAVWAGPPGLHPDGPPGLRGRGRPGPPPRR